VPGAEVVEALERGLRLSDDPVPSDQPAQVDDSGSPPGG
jgi:hypothetical protein